MTVDILVHTARAAASDEISHYGSIMRLRYPFLKTASDADLSELAHMALQEENETAKGLLLRLFWCNMRWNKPFPLGVTPLLEYAQSDNEILCESALGCLEAFKDKRVHDLAVLLLKTKGVKSLALGLLKMNYKKSDDGIIADAVRKATSVTQYIQSDIADIYSRYRSVGALPTLLHVYKRGECSHCRYNIVKAMHYCKVLPDEILAECMYDSFEDTRKFAKRMMLKNK